MNSFYMFLIGLFVGAVVAVFAMSLLYKSKEADKQSGN